MIIRKYKDIPATYAPDVGEIVHARRSGVDERWVRAVVIYVQRTYAGALKVKVLWLEDDPRAGMLGKPIVRNTFGWVVTTGAAPLIKQISKDEPVDRSVEP